MHLLQIVYGVSIINSNEGQSCVLSLNTLEKMQILNLREPQCFKVTLYSEFNNI